MYFLEGGLQSGAFGCMKIACDFVTQYCELHDETTRNGKSADAAFQCVKNQLPTRSGSLCGDKSVFGKIWKNCDRQPKIVHETDIFNPRILNVMKFSIK